MSKINEVDKLEQFAKEDKSDNKTNFSRQEKMAIILTPRIDKSILTN